MLQHAKYTVVTIPTMPSIRKAISLLIVFTITVQNEFSSSVVVSAFGTEMRSFKTGITVGRKIAKYDSSKMSFGIPKLTDRLVSSSSTTLRLSSSDIIAPLNDVNTVGQDIFSSLINFPKPSLSSTVGYLQNGLKSTQNLLPNLLKNVNLENVGSTNEIFTFIISTLRVAADKVTESNDALINILDSLNLPVASDLLIVAFIFSVVFIALEPPKPEPPLIPYPKGRYDPETAASFFSIRQLGAFRRATEILSAALGFGVLLLKDKVSNNMESNSDLRASQLTEILTALGPTFIKVGQSLSIRTDLLSPAYVRGLKSLQDNVPAFSNAEAKQIIEEDFGVPLEKIFSNLGDPVAAASLGQVYRATLQTEYSDVASDNKDIKVTGENTVTEMGSDSYVDVAVKVQRPDVLFNIALDMYLLRTAAPIIKKIFNLGTDTVGTVDAWGSGFVDELDYIAEASNAEMFQKSIQNTPLAGAVFAPRVSASATSRRVLTTEWVEGERLDKSAEEDVTVLCGVAMNTYLTMMLETGLLHCDPHPGNLLRTPDGKLCILDWGMVTTLDSNLQVTLIEHMAHLTSADYAEIPKDLLELGFIPESKADLINDSGIVDVLADIYGAWTKGGGAATINVNKVISQLQDLQATRGGLFQIPPYFAYIAKSFSVLEGIGLSNDSNYSIINQCLPYISKRLLTDTSSRTGGALSTFVFGPDKVNIESRIVDYDRVEQLVSGFGEYSTSASGGQLGRDGRSRTEIIEDLVDGTLDLLAAEQETPLQAIFIEQLAKLLTSGTRAAWTSARERSGTFQGRSVLGRIVDPLGLFRTSPVVRMNDVDKKALDTTRKLVKLLGSTANGGLTNTIELDDLSNTEMVEFSRVLTNKMWARRKGIASTGGRLATALLKLTADKLERGERDLLILESVETDVTTVTTDSLNSNSLSESEVGKEERESNTTVSTAAQILSKIKADEVMMDVDTHEENSEPITRISEARRILTNLETEEARM